VQLTYYGCKFALNASDKNDNPKHWHQLRWKFTIQIWNYRFTELLLWFLLRNIHIKIYRECKCI